MAFQLESSSLRGLSVRKPISSAVDLPSLLIKVKQGIKQLTRGRAKKAMTRSSPLIEDLLRTTLAYKSSLN